VKRASDRDARPQAVLFDGLSSLKLKESQPIIYDRPIGMRMLYQDPVSGADVTPVPDR
jgi:hypothetical protein